jgi:amino acid transporter
MILIMWPIAGLALLFMTLAMGELASAYPVAGAMASWAWTCARKGIGGERAWGWVMGGLVMGYHVGVVGCRGRYEIRRTARPNLPVSFFQMCLISWQSAKLVNETIYLAIQDYVLRDWVTALFSMVSELSRLSI